MKRVVRRILCAFAFGSIVTWLIAWGHAIWDAEYAGVSLTSEQIRPLLADRISVPLDELGSISSRHALGKATRICTVTLTDPGRGRSSTIAIYDQGWPIPAFRAVHCFGHVVRREGLHGGFVLRTSSGRPDRVVAYWPRPLGFVANAAVFSLPMFALWTVAAGGRALWRSRHGRCRYCNYDLRASPHRVCPECGGTLRRTRAAQPLPCAHAASGELH